MSLRVTAPSTTTYPRSVFVGRGAANRELILNFEPSKKFQQLYDWPVLGQPCYVFLKVSESDSVQQMTRLGMQHWLLVCNPALPALTVCRQFCVRLFVGLSREVFVRHNFATRSMPEVGHSGLFAQLGHG